jgi:hypothetical protein
VGYAAPADAKLCSDPTSGDVYFRGKMKERPRESGAFAIFARFIDLPDHHHCDPPGPDFIGPHPEAPNTVLGVELSEYFQDSQPGEGSQLKNTRELRQQIRNRRRRVIVAVIPSSRYE